MDRLFFQLINRLSKSNKQQHSPHSLHGGCIPFCRRYGISREQNEVVLFKVDMPYLFAHFGMHPAQMGQLVRIKCYYCSNLTLHATAYSLFRS